MDELTCFYWLFIYEFAQSSAITGEDNLYGLKVILWQGKSFLGWTPLPEHKNRVSKFRLTYKISVGDRWETVEEPSSRFPCPPGFTSRDFCYDLSSLQSNVQYTSDITYQLTNGDWSRKGNPLFFILVEGVVITVVTIVGPSKIPDSPNMMNIIFKTDTTAEVSWLPPLSELRIDEYKISARILSSQNPRVSPGTLETFRAPGNAHKYLLENLMSDTVYNVSVEAGAEGIFGPSVWELVSAVPAGVPELKEPRVYQRGEITTVSWDVTGSIRRLCCFQL
uniref:Fibronectin type-III domain-containing protein n=1 Tax=Romanomermis culicivorax TaxID=13658 RepID=A0A915K244_ROMCU